MKKIFLLTMIFLLTVMQVWSQEFMRGWISYNITSVENRTVEIIKVPRDLTGILTVPETVNYNDIDYTVTAITGSSALLYSENFTEIELPASLETITDGVFQGCKNLIAFHVHENNQYFSTVDGVLFDKKKEKLVSYAKAKESNSYTVPNGVTVIGKHAFQNSNTLTEIILPATVNAIGTCAFYFCDNLTNITYYNPEPPMVVDGPIHLGAANIEIRVPIGSKEKFIAVGFRGFKSITEFDASSIPITNATVVNVYPSADGIIIAGLQIGETISIYTVTGQMLYQLVATNNEETIVLPKGIYIVNVGKSIFKIKN